MGRPKATLEFGGRPLLQVLVDRLSAKFQEIVVVAAPEFQLQGNIDLCGAKIIHDEVAFAGPLGALEHGLGAIRNDRAFVCSCDLPFLDAGVASAMVGMIGDFDAVIPNVGGMLQPLHAAYRTRCMGILASMAARGEKRLTAIVDAARVKIMNEPELRALNPELRSFFNVNTPTDYARALAMAKRD